jgi:hypothetical protein
MSDAIQSAATTIGSSAVNNSDVLPASLTVMHYASDKEEAILFLRMLGLVEDDKG